MCSFHVWLSRITFHREAAFQLSRKIAHKRGLPVRLSFVHGAPGVIYSFCKRRKGAHALLEATMNATWCNASLRREFLSFEPRETNHARDSPTSARKSRVSVL